MFMKTCNTAATSLSVITLQSHSSVERAGLIGGVIMKKVPTDDTYTVKGEMLKKMVEEDKAAGLIPFYVGKHTSYIYT